MAAFGWVVKVGIEISHPVVGFIGMRHAIPPQSKIQGQPFGGAPVVLDICGPRNVVPLTAILNREFGVVLRVTEQEISEVNPSVGVVEGEETLGLTEQVLYLFVNCPAATDLELMRSLGPGNIVANLVIVSFVVPWPTRGRVVGAGRTAQFDFWEYGPDCSDPETAAVW